MHEYHLTIVRNPQAEYGLGGCRRSLCVRRVDQYMSELHRNVAISEGTFVCRAGQNAEPFSTGQLHEYPMTAARV